MNRPTPFRKAVNHLKNLGIIKRDNELLSLAGIGSKGALSAYLGGRPPKHIIDKFLDKYGEHVAHFFAEEEKQNDTPPKKAEEVGIPTTKDYIAELKADKAFYQELLKTSLVSMNDKLKKLVEEKVSSPVPEDRPQETASAEGRKQLDGMSHRSVKKLPKKGDAQTFDKGTHN